MMGLLAWAGIMAVGALPPSVMRVETPQKLIALTFDACATSAQANGFDKPIFDILAREGTPATVFLSARWVAFHPVEAQILADAPWLALGSHGDTHAQLSHLTERRIEQELARGEQAVAALGRTSVGARPPFGDWDGRAERVAQRLGVRLWLWDVASGDAGGHLSPPAVYREVVTRARPGSIVIFHINGRGPATAHVLPGILHELRARGFRFVTLPQLLAEADRIVPARPHRYRKKARRGQP